MIHHPPVHLKTYGSQGYFIKDSYPEMKTNTILDHSYDNHGYGILEVQGPSDAFFVIWRYSRNKYDLYRNRWRPQCQVWPWRDFRHQLENSTRIPSPSYKFLFQDNRRDWSLGYLSEIFGRRLSRKHFDSADILECKERVTVEASIGVVSSVERTIFELTIELRRKVDVESAGATSE